MKAGDRVCFYASKQKEVVAHANLSGAIDQPITDSEWPEPDPPGKQLYKVPLSDIVWLEQPIKIDLATRATLDAFKGRNPAGNWSFLVQTTCRLSAADFARLIGA